MKKKLLKNLLALVIGGALSSAAAVEIDPDHFGKSLKAMGKQVFQASKDAVLSYIASLIGVDKEALSTARAA